MIFVAVAAKQPSEEPESTLSFIPAGLMRSIAEYLAATIPGAILLFAFFLAAEGAMIFIGGDLLTIAFLPVICIMPILSGVVSTLILEKLRKKPLTLQRGAMVGAAAGFAGALVSVLMLVLVDVFVHKPPFGSLVTGWLTYVVLLMVLVMDTVLGALGGALVVKFIKDV